MHQDNAKGRLKSFTSPPNIFFAITFVTILLFEVEKYGVRPFAFGSAIGWLFLPSIGIIYYNSVYHDTKKDRYGVMILTGMFLLIWISGRLLH